VLVDNELNIFSLRASSPEEAAIHGAADARAWVAGALRADDQLDLSAEFDAQFSARLGGAVAGGLASFDADASAAAHAGLRLTAGMPIDLFEAAGVMARLRLEASANAQARVTAAMSLVELHQLLLDGLPAELRPYARIVLEQLRVGATVWARGSFAAMAVAEVTAVAKLFPADGSRPGMSATFNYGFAWGYGGAWGVVVNAGFDTRRLLRQLSGQAATDVTRALTSYREQAGLAPDDPLRFALEAAETVLPTTLDTLVSWAQREVSRTPGAQRESLSQALYQTLRKLVSDALVPKLLAAAVGAIGADPGAITPMALRRIWADLVRAVAALGDAADDGELEAVGAVAELVQAIADVLPPDVRTTVRRVVRGAGALLAIASEDSGDSPALRRMLGAAPTGGSLRGVAAQVVVDELAGIVADLDLLPEWLARLLGDTARLTVLLAGDDEPGRRDAVAALARLLGDVSTAMADAGVWDHLATVLPADLVRALRAGSQIVVELGAAVVDDQPVDAHRAREAVSVGILMLVGRPLSDVFHLVADRGFSAVPPALRGLADEFDASQQAIDLDASWTDLARQVAGTTVGFPAAQLLRHVAHTTEQWTATVLPGELALLDRYLRADQLVDQILALGTGPAIAAFKKDLLPVVGRHVIEHVLSSLEFLVKDSVTLFSTMADGLATRLMRSLELSAVVAFRLAEDSVGLAEQAVGELQRREQELAGKIERAAATFFQQMAALADVVGSLETQVGAAVTDWLVQRCLEPAGAALPDWSRPALTALVTLHVNAATGGLLSATAGVVRSFSGIIRASAEALRITAETPEGASVGLRPLLESLFRGDQLPPVDVPIGIDIPNPLLPFILPSIHIEVVRVPVPANIVAGVVTTLVFDAVGVGPLIRALDDTADSLRLTKAALTSVRGVLAGNTASDMRAALDQARPGAPLTVEVTAPAAGAVAPAAGVVTVRFGGANWSFVDPQGEGLPAEATSRIRIVVNGREVPLSAVTWADYGTAMEARIPYAGEPAAGSGALTVPAGPVSVMAMITDGTGAESARAARHFIVERPAVPVAVLARPWFPIAVDHPFIAVDGTQVLVPHRRVPIRIT
jgi:hypothetical protein